MITRKEFSKIVFIVLMLGIMTDVISTQIFINFFPQYLYEGNPIVRERIENGTIIYWETLYFLSLYIGSMWVYDGIKNPSQEKFAYLPALIYGGVRFLAGLHNFLLILIVIFYY